MNLNLLNAPQQTPFWILCSCSDRQVDDTDVKGLPVSEYVFHFLFKLTYDF